METKVAWSHYILIIFPICQEANDVSKESACTDNMKLYTAGNCTSSFQTHVTEVVKDMCDNCMVSFCKVSAGTGRYLFFIDI